MKDKWGVHVSFSKRFVTAASSSLQLLAILNIFSFCLHFSHFSDEWGLHLVIDKVKENSPAWKGGLRNFDCIVSVHGWVITLFDKAEVS